MNLCVKYQNRSFKMSEVDAQMQALQDLRRQVQGEDRRLPDLSHLPHGAGAVRPEDRLRGGDQGERRQVAQCRAGCRGDAQDGIQSLRPEVFGNPTEMERSQDE